MRQTEMAGAAPAGRSRDTARSDFRLDPALPTHRFQTELAGSALVGQTTVNLGETVVVQGTLKCGIPTRVACRPSSFRGVAVRLTLTEDDTVLAELVLLHNDPSLNLPVAQLTDMDDLAADWQMWARRFNLPLILIEPDGYEQVITERVGGLSVSQPKPRRPHSAVLQRRPRFLRRRKTGSVDGHNRVAGREIIARD
ncbi:MAG: DUF6101 family protein [Pseudomonadota bacterium]